MKNYHYVFFGNRNIHGSTPRKTRLREGDVVMWNLSQKYVMVFRQTKGRNLSSNTIKFDSDDKQHLWLNEDMFMGEEPATPLRLKFKIRKLMEITNLIALFHGLYAELRNPANPIVNEEGFGNDVVYFVLKKFAN